MVHPWLILVRLVLFIPLCLFLPGYATRQALVADSSDRARPDWLKSCFDCLLFSIALTGWVSVILTQLGWFSLPHLLLCNLSYALALGLLAWRRGTLWSAACRPVGRWGWALLGVIFLAAILFLHPHEFIFGGADAGVYVNLGANIARTGSWLVHDAELTSLDPALYPAMFREQPPGFLTRYIQFPGFYVADDQPGPIIPQFYPLHAVWLAVFYALGGLRASLVATPMWGLLGCLAVYFAARSLFSQRVGVLAAGFLTITATQVWFSRYPTSETLTQFLLFGGIYALALYITDESPWTGLLAGLALGQVTLVRVDMYFLLAVPACYAVYLRLERRLRAHHLAFFAPFLALTAYSLLFAWLQSWPYFHNTYRSGLQSLPLPWPLVVAICLACVIAYVAFDRWVENQPDWPRRLASYGRWTRMTLAVLVVLAAVYGYFLRPSLADTTATYYYWYGDSRIPSVESDNLVRLGWYISPLGIALAVLGVWQMLRREVNARTTLFLGVGMFFSFLFLGNSRNNPHHIYVMRRYVPAVIPAFLIAAAYALDRWLGRVGWRRWFASGLAVVLVGWLLYSARVAIFHIEHRGAAKQFEKLIAALGSEPTVILFNDNLAVSSGATIGTPLRYLYGYTVFDLQEEHVDASDLQAQIGRWQDGGRRVLVAVGPQGVQGLFAAFRPVQVIDFQLDVPVLETSYEHFPQEVQRHTVTLQVFELGDVQ